MAKPDSSLPPQVAVEYRDITSLRYPFAHLANKRRKVVITPVYNSYNHDDNLGRRQSGVKFVLSVSHLQLQMRMLRMPALLIVMQLITLALAQKSTNTSPNRLAQETHSK